MCEWLSYGEWCDVQLVCAGRTFNAHRAVLASVSIFLRNLLLSCPENETPTSIVLPDFDLEALSSVLYYIYNGKVTVDKQKLIMFLEIIKALEIFIDRRYLDDIENIEENYFHYNTYKYKQNEKIFTLNSKDINGMYINIRKGEHVQEVESLYAQYPAIISDFDNERESHRDSSDSHASSTNRQRHFSLRDLCIETYPRNGNVNGLTGRVLAISNEHYRVPRSVFSTNANASFTTRPGDMDTKTNTVQTVNTYFSQNAQVKSNSSHMKIQTPNGYEKELYSQICWQSNDSTKEKIMFDDNSKLGTDVKNNQNSCDETNCTLNKTLWDKFQHSLSIDLSITRPLSSSLPSIPYDYVGSKNLRTSNNLQFLKSLKHSVTNKSLGKSPILNQVIESPWRPRLPNNYKPFKRKVKNSIDNASHCKKEYRVNYVNDNNNNLENFDAVSSDKGPVDTKKELKCNVCNQIFTTNDCLSNHMKRHNIAPRYSCGDCGKNFSQLRNFKYHMSVHRGTREFAATCTICGKYFNDRGYLSSHMKIHRNRKEYKCSQCPKSFNQRVAYNMHVRIHTGVKPHVCEECGKAFSRKMLLKQHQRTHSGERPYACPHCEKRFADRSNMTLHLRLHTGVKPFSCSLCPKSFTKKHHLKSHLNFHTGAKPYSCPRCKLAFTQSSNMRTHLKKCSAPVPDVPTT